MSTTLDIPAGRGAEALRPDGLPPRQRVKALMSYPIRIVGRLVMPAFWLALILIILAPCAAFLILAVSPRLFDQGDQWFTLTYLRQALSGATAVALTNSIWVSSVATVFGTAVGGSIAWTVARTNLPGRRLVTATMWLALLLPSWLPSIGWVQLFQADGVMYRLGFDYPGMTTLILGPFGVVLVLGLRCVPFAYLAITAALAGLGQEFDDAARVHGASRIQALRVVVPIIAPAIWAALAIGFAESVSDYGVAATLAYSANFPLATFELYGQINNFPANFPLASALGWLLVATIAIPLALQARALRGRSYAILSGRTRQAVRKPLSLIGGTLAVTGILFYYLLALGVPAFGAVSQSLLADFGASFQVSWANYREVFHSSTLIGPLLRSLRYGVIVASITVVGGFVIARLLTKVRTKAVRMLDFLLLAAIALPSVLFAAGYIFAYNLPFLSDLGINLYQTQTLLVIAYVAASLPLNSRVLVGAVSQIQPSLTDAARAHGAGPIVAWWRGVFPLMSKPLLIAWLLTFTGIFLELPISQLLYAPSQPPLSVAIEDNLSNYHFGVGLAQSVVAVAIALIAVGGVLGLYRLLAPRGWRRLGEATNR